MNWDDKRVYLFLELLLILVLLFAMLKFKNEMVYVEKYVCTVHSTGYNPGVPPPVFCVNSTDEDRLWYWCSDCAPAGRGYLSREDLFNWSGSPIPY